MVILVEIAIVDFNKSLINTSLIHGYLKRCNSGESCVLFPTNLYQLLGCGSFLLAV